MAQKFEGMNILKNRGYEGLIHLDFGGQGNVYKTKKNRVIYAAKVVHTNQRTKTIDEELQRELTIIQSVNHLNLIKVIDCFRTKNKVFIIMDFMVNRSISHEIDTKREPFCEWKAKVYFTQISSAIKYLHSNDIAHRDLKLSNVLLDKHFNVKVSDFGHSIIVQKDPKTGKIQKSVSIVGTPVYIPPELMVNRPYDPFKSDMWCLGVCLYVMVNYSYPFIPDTKEKTYSRQMNKNYKLEPNLSSDVKDLINKLLEPKLEKRIDIKQVCKHLWIPNTLID